MFSWFKKKKKEEKKGPILADLNQNAITEGDLVMSLRYDLGMCKVVKDDTGLVYESVETGKQVSWVKMIDAATELQKVRKIDPGSNGHTKTNEP